jgi:hypothetical protein
VAYLRERLAEHPAEGYKTWDERVAELDAARSCGAGGTGPGPMRPMEVEAGEEL